MAPLGAGVATISALCSALAAAAETTLQIEDEPLTTASGHLVGFGIEDVNHELYGGLYSQMIYGEDFEETAGSSGVSGDLQTPPKKVSPTWTPVGADHEDSSTPPAFETTSSNGFNGEQAQVLLPGASLGAAILNRGLYQQGLHLEPNREYGGYLFARSAQGGADSEPAKLRISLVSLSDTSLQSNVSTSDLHVLSSQEFTVESAGNWTRIDFTLNADRGASCHVVNDPSSCRGAKKLPEGECVLCRGGLVLAASGATVAVDFVFLQPGEWGRFQGLPVRRDVAEAFQQVGVNALRLGGSTCNVDGWRWKNMRGPREHRAPYEGLWHPFASQGFRMFEFLDMCEELGVLAVVTLNNQETPEDLADLVEYAYGAPTAALGRLRVADGRQRPYAPFVVEIGNEQLLTDDLARQVSEGAAAMRKRAGTIGLDPEALRFAIGQNLGKADINTPVCDAMVNATKFLGESVMWDLHVDGDTPDQEDQWKETLDMAMQMLDRLGSKMKLAVFEENAHRHDLVRGLNRARYANTFARLGHRFTIGTAANGLQVIGHNDNNCDQGAIFMAPDRVWLSPFGQADVLIARSSEAVVLQSRFAGSWTNLSGRDVGPGCPNALQDATISQCEAHALANGYLAFGRTSAGLCCFKSGAVSDLLNRLVTDQNMQLYYYSEAGPGLDVLASRSGDMSAIAVRVVNWGADVLRNLSIALPVGTACAGDVTVAALAAPDATAVNPPSDPERVSPKTWAVEAARNLTVEAMSLLTVKWTGCARSLGGVRPAAPGALVV